MATGTVTIDKAYFETLLRRAQFHTSGVDFTTPVNLPTVTIPKTDHDSLLSQVGQYNNLRRNLYRGGIAEETLAVLIKDDTENGDSTYSAIEDSAHANAFLNSQSAGQGANGNSWRSGGNDGTSNGGGGLQDYTYGRNANYAPQNGDLRTRDNNQHHSQTNDDFAYMPDDPSDGFYDDGNGNDFRTKSTRQQPQFDKFAKRTVLLVNLPEGITHADVVEVVRGGMLLDIYVRTHDRTASVSFLEEVHAQDFFRHVKRHDLYIRGKRVEIRWNDRQFVLPGHVANKITIGATRNLVIHNRSPKHTEDLIRDDLEHIHNLVIIKISFIGKDAYISTNSVHNAMFARTCMMSRATYKGSKIEWDDDECAAPLIRPQPTRQENNAPKKSKKTPPMNRFQLLNMDGTEDGSDEEDDHDICGISLPTAISPLAA